MAGVSTASSSLIPMYLGSDTRGCFTSTREFFTSGLYHRLPQMRGIKTPMGASSSSVPSSSAARGFKNDVFLSFRGADTRKGITSDLYHQLQMRGIKTFMDDRDLEVGDVISPTLNTAIEESRYAIIVLSENYATSTWCLEELAKICECMKDQNRILPLFYHVEPSDVRYQKKSFEEAFSKHKTTGRYPSEKIQRWRDALSKVATFSGWNTKDYKTERELVGDIVGFVGSKVRPPDAIESTGDFEEYEATRQAMDEVMKALTDDEITAVGVYGMGGVGKTSMVRHAAAQACKKGTFYHWIMAAISQIPDLRKIQGTLADLLGVKLEGETEIGRAISLYKEIMRREKLLIILDDVWDRIELSSIGIPSYKGLQNCKSKVLLTTRRLDVCNSMDIQASIPLNILSEQDSWKLFVRNAGVARKKILESSTFEVVARKVAGECRGLPIKLIKVARELRAKDQAEWDKAAQQLEKSQIQGTLAGPSGCCTGKPNVTVTNWGKGAHLGSGSFGSVYEGITDGGCFIAVKEVSLLDQGSLGRKRVSQLEQEIALLSRFEHENIVQYYGTQKDESKLYIFLELVTKGSLEKLYQTYSLTESQVSVYTGQILQGLKYLHDQNVIHRDIKCANILVHANGSVKLADFGLAKAIKTNNIISCQGTANWMAPEVVNHESQGYGLLADIWSLGCTVLEMLTGMVPYSDLEWMAALWKIGNGKLPLVPDSLSREAQDFIHLCLQVEPDNRPTAAQLLEHPFVNKPLPPTSSGSVSPYNHHGQS